MRRYWAFLALLERVSLLGDGLVSPEGVFPPMGRFWPFWRLCVLRRSRRWRFGNRYYYLMSSVPTDTTLF